MSQEQINALGEMGCTISDTETTGLNPKLNGLTEVASIRFVKKKGSKDYRVEQFRAFIKPLRPEYRDYEEACERAKTTGTPLPAYDRKKYEYFIEPQALNVTGTKILRNDAEGREDLNGPITAIEVNGQRQEAVMFDEVMEDFLAFTHHGANDLYYNAPFDKPFLAQQMRDVLAYQWASMNYHLTGHEVSDNSKAEEKQRIETFRQTLRASEPTMPHTKISVQKVEWEQATAEERLQIVQEVKDAVPLPPEYTNPSLYQCLMYAYFYHHGFEGSNRLDDAYRNLVDEDFRQRGDHEAAEDIVMAAKVMLAMTDKKFAKKNYHVSQELSICDPARFERLEHIRVGQTPAQPHFATMADLYAHLLEQFLGGKADTKARDKEDIFDAAKFPLGIRGKPDIRLREGNIEMIFPPGFEKNSKAAALWNHLQAYYDAAGRARPASDSDPVSTHLLKIDKNRRTVVINADGSRPKHLSLFKKLLLYRDIIHAREDNTKQAIIKDIFPYDTQGTKMDVLLKGEDEPFHALPMNALRANLKEIQCSETPEDALYKLHIIREVYKMDKGNRIGLVMVRRDKDKGGVNIIIRGHLRGMGEARLFLRDSEQSGSNAFDDNRERIHSQVKFLVDVGVLPYVDTGTISGDNDLAEAVDIEEEGEISDDKTKEQPYTVQAASEVSDNPNIRITLSDNVVDLILNTLPDQFRYEVQHQLDRESPDAEAAHISSAVIPTLRFRDKEEKDSLRLKRIREPGKRVYYTLEGPRDAFYDYPLVSKEDAVQAQDDVMLDERTKHLIGNACWLTYRLQQIPGTSSVSFTSLSDALDTRDEGRKRLMAILHQEDGVSDDAVDMLYDMEMRPDRKEDAHNNTYSLPMKAYAKEIRLDAGQMMPHAFDWSKMIGRNVKAMTEKRKKGNMALKKPMIGVALDVIRGEHIRSVDRGKHIRSVEMSEERKCWIKDHDTMNHQLDMNASPPVLLTEKARGLDGRKTGDGDMLDVSRSSVIGPHHFRMTKIKGANGKDVNVFKASRLVLTLASAYLAAENHPPLTITEKSENFYVEIDNEDVVMVEDAVREASRLVYRLSKMTGFDRQQVDHISLEKDGKVHLCLNTQDMFNAHALSKVFNCYKGMVDSDLRQLFSAFQRDIREDRDRMDYRNEEWELKDWLAKIVAMDAQMLWGGDSGEEERKSVFAAIEKAIAEARGSRADTDTRTLLLEEINRTGGLIHDLATIVGNPRRYRPVLSEKDVRSFDNAMTDVRHLHGRMNLANFGLESLAEEAMTAHMAYAGGFDPKYRHHSLRRKIADAWLEVGCDLLLAEGKAEQKDKYKAYKGLITKHYGKLLECYDIEVPKDPETEKQVRQPISGAAKEKVIEKINRTYERHALTLLSALNPKVQERDGVVPSEEHAPLARALLEEAGYSAEQAEALIKLYEKGDKPAVKEKVEKKVKEAFPLSTKQSAKHKTPDRSVDDVLQQYRWATGQDGIPITAELSLSERKEIEGDIAKAYEKRAKFYLQRITDPEADAGAMQERAEHMLKTAYTLRWLCEEYEGEDIDPERELSWIEKGRKASGAHISKNKIEEIKGKVKEAVEAYEKKSPKKRAGGGRKKAEEETTKQPDEAYLRSDRLNEHEERIEHKGHRQRYREISIKKKTAQKAAHTKALLSVLPDPDVSLRVKRQLAGSLNKFYKESDDWLKVRPHVVQYVSTMVALLAQDGTLYDNLSAVNTSGNEKVKDIAEEVAKLRRIGLQKETLSTVENVRKDLDKAAKEMLCMRLQAEHIDAEISETGDIMFDVDALVRPRHVLHKTGGEETVSYKPSELWHRMFHPAWLLHPLAGEDQQRDAPDGEKPAPKKDGVDVSVAGQEGREAAPQKGQRQPRNDTVKALFTRLKDDNPQIPLEIESGDDGMIKINLNRSEIKENEWLACAGQPQWMESKRNIAGKLQSVMASIAHAYKAYNDDDKIAYQKEEHIAELFMPAAYAVPVYLLLKAAAKLATIPHVNNITVNDSGDQLKFDVTMAKNRNALASALSACFADKNYYRIGNETIFRMRDQLRESRQKSDKSRAVTHVFVKIQESGKGRKKDMDAVLKELITPSSEVESPGMRKQPSRVDEKRGGPTTKR